MILAGDVGGTKVVLGLFEEGDDPLEPVREERFTSADHDGLEAVVGAFLRDGDPVSAACFGVAGPVIGDRIEMTNLPWAIDGRALERALGIPTVHLLNDVAATAYAIDVLPEDLVATIHDGEERSRTRALLAAGTGLGSAVLAEAGGRPVVLSTEGGHVDYAPRNDEEVALFDRLRTELGRVSVERIVSGPGIHAIYRFLRDTGREEEPAGLAERLAASGDPSATISRLALEGAPPICVETMRRFTATYGAAAGDLALAVLALGGVYLGGGIAPQILPLLTDEVFIDAFLAKGRMGDLLARVPVRVILEPKAALLGAARYAALGP